MHNGWIKKNTNVLGSRTAMELKGISCVSLEPYLKKKGKLAVCLDLLVKKLRD